MPGDASQPETPEAPLPPRPLADTDAEVTDQALDSCPVGALLKKRVGYQEPVGRRLYDLEPIGSDIEGKRGQEPFVRSTGHRP